MLTLSLPCRSEQNHCWLEHSELRSHPIHIVGKGPPGTLSYCLQLPFNQTRKREPWEGHLSPCLTKPKEISRRKNNRIFLSPLRTMFSPCLWTLGSESVHLANFPANNCCKSKMFTWGWNSSSSEPWGNSTIILKCRNSYYRMEPQVQSQPRRVTDTGNSDRRPGDTTVGAPQTHEHLLGSTWLCLLFDLSEKSALKIFSQKHLFSTDETINWKLDWIFTRHNLEY